MRVEINPLVAEAHKLKSDLDLLQNVYSVRNEHVKASRLRITLYRAIQRFHRRLDKFEWRSNETLSA